MRATQAKNNWFSGYKIFFCAIFFIAGIAPQTQAGPNRPGGGISEGGGKVVLCKNATGAIISARTLDLFEGEQIRGFQFDESLLAQDEWTTALNILSRLGKFDEIRAQEYIQRLNEFRSETRFLPDANIMPVNDSNHSILPKDCELAQAAMQRSPQFPRDPRYLIDESIWSKMDIKNRAALVLHEIIYREAKSLGQEDSTKARYFTSTITSTQMNAFSVSEYVEILNAIDFKYSFYIQVRSHKYYITAVTETRGHGGYEAIWSCPNGMKEYSTAGNNDTLLTSIANAVAKKIGNQTEISLGYIYVANAQGKMRVLSLPRQESDSWTTIFDHVICK